jgi:hypothetical protein
VRIADHPEVLVDLDANAYLCIEDDQVFDLAERFDADHTWCPIDAGHYVEPLHIAATIPDGVSEAVAALLATGADISTKQVLHGPRWVADWLYREAHRCHPLTPPFIQTVDTTGLDPLTIDTAATLWDPTPGAPMNDLATAVHTAHTVTT